MKLRIPLRALLIAATGACGLLCMSTAQAEIRTGSASVNLLAPSEDQFIFWDVGRASYYDPGYFDYPSIVSPSPSSLTTGTAAIQADSFGTLSLYPARAAIVTTFFNPPATRQSFTGSLDLGALVDNNQTYLLTSNFPVVYGGEIKRFGYAFAKPTGEPGPTIGSTQWISLFGWVELDASDSTLGNLVVNATWAYDTTGAPIAVGTVPEPTTLMLVGLGCLALLARYRFRSKQS